MKKYALCGVAAIAVLVSAHLASAQDMFSPDRFALGVGVGTNGGLIEGSYKLTPQFVLRGQGAFIDFDDGFKSSDVKYSGRLHFNTGGGFVDWHPWSNPWLFSAGGVGGERKVDLKATPAITGTIKINGQQFPITEVGEVDGTADFGSPAPFVGLGWDNTFYSAHKIAFRAVAGVIFGDDPKVNLHAVGPFAEDATVISDVQAEQASLENDVHDYRYYPVVQLGVNYRF